RLDLLELGVEAVGDLVAVLVHDEEAEPEDRLAAALGRYPAHPLRHPGAYLRHVAEPERHPLLELDRDLAELFETVGTADAVDQEHSPGVRQVAAADV